MYRQARIEEIEFTIHIDDLLGPLGYGNAENVQAEIMETIISETHHCQELMRGRTMFVCVPFRRTDCIDVIDVDGLTIEDKTLVACLDGAKAFAVAICTVGPEIDKLIDEYFERGDYLQGMIADVVGNRAVEDVARKCASFICADARELNLSTANQISPGYGKWDTSGQRPVFALLDPSPIGVSLNDYCMMDPKKSISFVTPLVEGGSDHKERPPCHACDFQNCSYRRN